MSVESKFNIAESAFNHIKSDTTELGHEYCPGFLAVYSLVCSFIVAYSVNSVLCSDQNAMQDQGVLCRIVYDYEDYGLSMAAMRFVNRYGPKSGFADEFRPCPNRGIIQDQAILEHRATLF